MWTSSCCGSGRERVLGSHISRVAAGCGLSGRGALSGRSFVYGLATVVMWIGHQFAVMLAMIRIDTDGLYSFAHWSAPLLGTCTGICSYISAVSPRRPRVESSSRLRKLCSLSSNSSVTQTRTAVMTEQTMDSSCSPAHARHLVARHRAVTARVSVTSRAAAIKVSWSFHAAHSLCAGCEERH